MSEVKTAATLSVEEKNIDDSSLDQEKWYDKSWLPFFPAYSQGLSQILILSFVFFLTPGLFNALSGLGGAGLSDIKLADNSNVALNSTFATIGFFSGAICNTIGPKWSLTFGASGYCIYVASLLCYFHIQERASGFVIFAGAWLGVTAACLWAAQGSIIMSYPTEATKGRFFGIFWTIFNVGAVIGSIVPLAYNIDSKGSAVNDKTYIVILVLMAFGCAVTAFMLPVSKVRKADGTRVIYQKSTSIKTELLELFLTIKKEPFILLMFPMFFASNWFYTYQMSDFNAGRFNIRTRSLNSLLYWGMQMAGALLLGVVLDLKFFSRKNRAFIGWAIIFVISMAIWGGGYAFQKQFTREDMLTITPMDFKDKEYIGPMFLYMFYAFLDASFQTFIVWVLGCLSNSSRKTAIYAGYYKGIQSAGAAIAYRLDSLSTPYMSMFGSSWGIIIGALLIMLPLLYFKVENHTDLEVDLKDIDQTEHDIIPISSPTQTFPAIR